MEAVYDKPAIVVTDKKLSNIQEFLPILEKLAQKGEKNLVLIADDVEGEALGALILNKLKGVFNVVAVKAPEFGDRRKDVLQDIAILTGATVVSDDYNITFENAGLEIVGRARKVIVGKDSTTIIEGAGPAVDVKARIKQILHQVDPKKPATHYGNEPLVKRAAALGGKVAVIKVGGATETEIEEKKFRVDDAVAAVKAALDEGVVIGGGVTLIQLAASVATPAHDDAAMTAGRSILKSSLEQPFRILMENAGINADEWLPHIRASKTGQGVNVNDPTKLVDLKKAGIIDPKRVTREAIQNAVSIAGTGMTMGALVVEVPQPAAAAQPGMGGMGADY
jgi:chaperonin GroEL